MQRLDNMLNTNRLAIKTEEMGKFVIEKKIINNEKKYLVTLPDIYRFENIRINMKNVLIFLSRLDIYDNFAEMHIGICENMAIKEYLIIDPNGFIRNASSLYVPEPEDRAETFGTRIKLKKLKSIITDPDMFNEMLDENLIRADKEILKKYDLYEHKYEVIEGLGKSSEKDTKYSPKIKVIK